VNVIAPIMTNADGLFLQTIYYPYSWALQFARGAVLNLMVDSAGYDVAGMENVPYVDAAMTFDENARTMTLFALNRDLSKSQRLELQWQDASPAKVTRAWLLTGDDLKASNSFSAPRRVAPQAFTVPPANGARSEFELPARSYAAVQWSIG
jgi:alpha-N-arabinofuranosidase